LTCGDEWLSYGELETRSDRLVHWLRARGMGREARLGVFGERSLGMMVAILGALKAGAAWVPLDPAHPNERLAKILPASGVAAVATQAAEAARLAGLSAELPEPPAIICWDAVGDGSVVDAGNPPPANAPRDLAYVFYTSGSTGQPKGAMVTHQGMANHLWAKVDLLGLDSGSVVVQNASHCFDVFVWQLLAPLVAGGRVVIYAGETALDPAVLLARLARDRVTVLELVPSLLEVLLEQMAQQGAAGERPRLEALAHLLSTGEALPVPLARRWFEFFRDVAIVNAFGPTECSDDTMHHVLEAAPPAAVPRVPVGRAVPGFAVYVLDRRLRLVPRGCPGQLAMAGVGVGRGYLGAPATTAAAFVPDPFARHPGGRLYLSGDLGRLKQDGVLEFLGRIDSQIKVRGQRIELGEVEAALARHPAIRQVAAVVRSNGGNDRLVAYCVADAAIGSADLRAFLAGSLPPAMLPEQFVELEAMPLNRNGKIDRQALPAPPAMASRADRDDFVAPRNEIEARIAEIWQELLEVPEVSVDDNFFEIGGHSLLAVQVSSRISYHQGVEVPLRLILENPALEDLAREVQSLLDRSWVRGAEGMKIPLLPEAEHYPLSPAQRLLWFQQRLDPTDTAFNMPEIWLLEGTLDLGLLKRSLAALIDRHASYRTSFTVVDGEPVQHIWPEVESVLELVDLSDLTGDEQEARIRALQQEEIHAPFDLGKPPWRGRVFKLAEDRHLLLIVVHHLVTDLLSFEWMLRDLKLLYRAFAAGESPSLAAVPIRYVDYAAWQNERLRRGELAAAEQYWTTKLGGRLPVLDLPDRRPQPPRERTRRSDIVSAPVDEAVASRLRGLAGEHGVTLFTALLAAANAFLARNTGQTDILHGTPAANRTHLDTEAMVGFFVNLLPLRTDLDGDPTFQEILERTRQTVVEAFTHEEYPFELLVRKLNPQRELGRAPIFSTLFVLMEVAADSSARLSEDLRIQPQMRADEWTSAYDFNLVFFEREPRLECAIAYQTDFFDRPAMERRVRQFRRLLGGIAANPRQRLSALPLFSEAELRELCLQALGQRELYALSVSQQEIWFQYQIISETPAYNLCLSADLDGPLESSALTAAVRAVVDRQAILRASLATADGRPFQRINPKVEVRWLEKDLAGLGPETQSRKLEAWEKATAEAPFDLETGPLCRFALARLSSSKHRLLVVMHDLIIDEPGLVAFLRQSFEAYAARLRGDAEPLPALELAYTDFAEFQQARRRERLLGPPQRAYWRRQLAGALPGFELPAQRPCSAVRNFAADRVELRLPPQRLDALVRPGLGGSAFATVLAALKLLFFRLSGKRDLVVALPTLIRPPELTRVLGRFTHTWPLRTRIDARRRFGELVARIDRTLAETVRHGDVAFHEVLAELEIERDASRPLMPVAIAEGEAVESNYGDLGVASHALAPREILFDMLIVAYRRSAEIEIVFFHQRELFDRATIARLAEGLDALLADVAARGRAPLDELEILSSSQRRQILRDFNRRAIPLPPHFAHRLFAGRAAEQPQAVAAVCGEEQISYRELEARAEGIARWLRCRGVGREDRIGLFGERTLGMLAALVGILSSGAAFVPLDPHQPDERLQWILDAVGLRFIACQGDMAERSLRLAAGARSQPGILFWDEATGLAAAGDELRSRPDAELVGATDLACVFYTSGSTGRPKGAMVHHAGMLNHLVAKIELLGLNERSVVVQNASHAFDISVWQFLAALVAGGRVVIYPNEIALDPMALLAAVTRDGATVLETVPSFLGAMLEALRTAGEAVPAEPAAPGCERLTHLISNAETLPVSLCRRWFEHFPRVALVNTYGATECSDDTTHLVMREPPAENLPRIPVGRPIAGVDHFVLDRYLRPVPVGWGGQVAMAGIGVGRGYLADPQRTATSFVPSPFADAPGSRLYLTGDLGRWTEAGILDFLGRWDHQVKIRGFRVELGEIEAALSRHPQVLEAAVAMREVAGGERPVAYVVPPAGADPEIAELRADLKQRLPDYMQPAAFVIMQTLPRTATGKVDRRALPAPDGSGFAGAEAAAQTLVEKLLAKIWAEVLGVGRCGIHDGFFDLGGDSILSIRLVSLAQREGIELTVRDLYEYQTIAELAAAVESRTRTVPGEEQVAEGDVPLLPIQHWFFDKDLVRPQHWNVALILTLTERMDPQRMEEALRQVLAHHDTFRLRFACGESGWRATTIAAAQTADFFHRFDLSTLAQSRKRAAVEAVAAELQRRLDLTAGPLLRVAFVDRGRRARPRCLFIFHHLIMDPISLEIVLGDLVSAYRQLERGEAVKLPAKTTSFQRWARLLEAHARSAELRSELPYWLERLPRRICSLPVDRPGGFVDESSAGVVTVALSAAETEMLLRRLPAVYGTQINDALLTALVEVIADWTGERALLVEIPGHGREEIFADVDLSRTVGWLNTGIPVWLDLRDASGPEEALVAVSQQLAGMPNRGLGYGLLRYLSGDERIMEQLAALPNAEIVFEYLGQSDRTPPENWPFSPAPESVGPRTSRRREPSREPCLLLVKAVVLGGRLKVEWLYGKNVHRRSTIQGLAQGYLEAIRALLRACRSYADGHVGARRSEGGDEGRVVETEVLGDA